MLNTKNNWSKNDSNIYNISKLKMVFLIIWHGHDINEMESLGIFIGLMIFFYKTLGINLLKIQ